MDNKKMASRFMGSKRSRSRGFTLVELMIVVVLIAVLAALTAPTISSSMERNRASQLNRDVANGFLAARSHAMRQGQAVLVQITPGANSELVFYEPGNLGNAGSCIRAIDNGPAGNGNNVLNRVSPAARGLDNVEFQQPDPNVTNLCISPSGRIVGMAGQPLEATGDGCDQMNFLLPMWDVEQNPSGLEGCDVGDDVDLLRQIHSFSMVHIGYGGQVRVIK